MNTSPETAPEQPPQEHSPAEAAAKSEPRDSWLTSLQSLLATVVIAVFAITFIVQAFQIPSESMETTLLIGDYLLVDKVHYSNGGIWGKILPYRDLQRGEIVVFRYPLTPELHFVKRVIGLPGDHVKLVNRHVYVNGQLMHDEKYARYSMFDENRSRDDFPELDRYDNMDPGWLNELPKVVKSRELIVPSNDYFVMGDNRDHSFDSRYWGFVPRENVVGRPIVVYWSIDTPPHSDSDGKLSRLGFVLRNLPSLIRWHRMLRIVN
ncbi:MAG: signal peptidase I [Terriglobales bacterium]